MEKKRFVRITGVNFNLEYFTSLQGKVEETFFFCAYF